MKSSEKCLKFFIKTLALLTTIASAHFTYAETCIDDEQLRKERSETYLNQVEFTFETEGADMDVVLSFPALVDGAIFSRAALAKTAICESDQGQFVFPLEAKQEQGRVRVWYMLSRELSEGNIVQAVYGESCGLVIQYHLDYQQMRLIPR